ncbi:hypothetical protein [Streptomyces albipurpureus]|uniref:Uncharacterized protein n=1 Tax=Streptomyces albipurpureus TaxID=2897419 RepID=A0ABT0V4J5_9ACTN|nr:hypothetical protein [Streptomyces sp. CWNU-1]MCM2394301.1 hypothetical protein [Streptomyces sp. CWNU-1]
MNRSPSRFGRIAAFTATTALTVALPLCGSAAAPSTRGPASNGQTDLASSGPVTTEPVSITGASGPLVSAQPPTTGVALPSASKPDGPIESSLSVAATGAIAGAATVMIVRRHQRRSRNSRR